MSERQIQTTNAIAAQIDSGCIRPVRVCSIADFVGDVASVANSLPTHPVVIAHSMGGLVAQNYLESH